MIAAGKAGLCSRDEQLIREHRGILLSACGRKTNPGAFDSPSSKRYHRVSPLQEGASESVITVFGKGCAKPFPARKTRSESAFSTPFLFAPSRICERFFMVGTKARPAARTAKIDDRAVPEQNSRSILEQSERPKMGQARAEKPQHRIAQAGMNDAGGRSGWGWREGKGAWYLSCIRSDS